MLYGLGLIFIIILGSAVINYTSPSSDNRNSDNKLLATPENPIVSPSGKFQLQVTQGFNGLVHFNRFDIAKIGEKGSDPEVVYVSKDTFRTRDRLYFLWDELDRVWVYSGDVGVFYWNRVNDEQWEKNTWSRDKKVTVPKLLKSLTPEFFTY